MAKKQDDLDQLAKSLRAVADDLELLVAKVRAGGSTTGAETTLAERPPFALNTGSNPTRRSAANH